MEIDRSNSGAGGEASVRLSKTQKKKAALSLQDLGERLVKLSDGQLKRIDLPGDVLAAVKAAKTIKKHVPGKRQMQYIGTLMRKCDPAPVVTSWWILFRPVPRIGACPGLVRVVLRMTVLINKRNEDI